MAYPTYEQWGIVFNILAGILMGLDYFINKDYIKIIDASLMQHVYALQNLRIYKINANFNLEKFIDGYGNKLLWGSSILLYFVRDHIPYFSDISSILNQIAQLKKQGGLDEFIGTILIWIIAAIYCLIILGFYVFLIYATCYTGKMIVKVLTISPRGIIGTAAIISFILGNALQLWATFNG
jgi:hypothetical protein